MKCISIGVANGRPATRSPTDQHAPRILQFLAAALGPGNTPPWPGLAPVAELDLDHLDLQVQRIGLEAVYR
jgi:hypothetical protein